MVDGDTVRHLSRDTSDSHRKSMVSRRHRDRGETRTDDNRFLICS